MGQAKNITRQGLQAVDEALRGMRALVSLTHEQQEVFLDRFSEETAEPSPEVKAFYASLEDGPGART